MQDDFIIEQVDDIVIIKLNMMRATIKEALMFKKILQNEINGGKVKIVIDLTQCNFVDSAVLGVIVTTAKELRFKGGDIRGIVNEGSVLNMFAQTGLEKVFKYFNTQELAVSSFS